MADEPQEERTEQPTPKRLADAKKKGEVPRSRELTMAGVTLAGAGALLVMAGPIGGNLVSTFGGGFSIERQKIFDASFLPVALSESFISAFTGLIPLIIVLLAAVFLSGTAIGGVSFSVKAFAFKPERLNPIKGLKRIFGPNGLMELVKAMGKFSLVGALAVAWLWFSSEELASLGRQPVDSAIAHALKICGMSLVIVSCGLIVIAAIDAPFQLWQFHKKMRMTRKEVRDEMKDTEGRPEVKSKIRTLQQQAAQRRMMEDIPIASVVITNPTHYAVALKYDENSMGAPRVVAKGKDLLAKRIREVATEHDVPLFSAPPLARALFRSTDLGDEIPAKLYSAVAQVLAYIFQLNETLKPGQRPMPKPVPEVNEDDFPDPRKKQ
ncbi:MAG: flagellar biosynthesis protein FlhB [Woeseiaceae bacterium]|nr:flagellar biosynthesis protein FlhB [Woeseiaceae bacterium]